MNEDYANYKQNTQNRRESLELEFRKMYAGANRPLPKALDTFLDVAMEDLKEIPFHQIPETFQKARMENTNITCPSNGKILSIFRENHSNSRKNHIQTVKDMMQRRLDNPTLFPDSMLEEAQKILDGTIPERCL